jgi:PAS domain S-box-containing protein/putative nucleotidyltransferase with HDIG domain
MHVPPEQVSPLSDVAALQPPPWLANVRRVALITAVTYALIGVVGIINASLSIGIGLRGVWLAAAQGFVFLIITAALIYRAITSLGAHVNRLSRLSHVLLQREEHYRELTERIPDIIYRYALSPTPRYTYISPIVTSILGYTPEEHYADPNLPRMYVHPDDRQLLEAAAREADAAVPQVLRCHHRDGHVVWLEYRMIQIKRDAQGAPLAIEGIVRDVTMREQMAPQLQLQRTALEATATAIVITARDGTIEWVNPAFTALTGYTAEEAIGQSPRILRTSYQPSAFYASLWETILRGEIWRGVLTNRRKNGSEYIEEQTITPVLVGDEIQHFVSIKQDITERVAVDRQRQALATIAETLRTAHSRAEMLPLLLEQTLLLLPAQGAAVALRDETTGDSVMELGVGTWSYVIGRRLGPGVGITGQVIATGVPYLSNDIASDPSFVPFSEGRGGMSAALCVPLYAYETVVGALWVARLSPFSPSDMQTLTAMAGFAASAIHRAALFELTEQRLRRLTGLHAIDVAINGSLDRHLALGTLLDQARELLQIDAVNILLLDPLQHVLTFAAGRGFRTRGFELIRPRLGVGVAGQVALSRQVAQIPDITSSQIRFTRHTLIEAEQFLSYYGVPLIAKGNVKGVMEVFHRSPLTPDREWLAFLETLAGQAAIAIDNTELFGELQQANTRLALAYDATIEGWSAALDLRDKETEGHTLRVTEMTARLANAVGIAPEEMLHIRRGALLHDIGKMGVPDQILLKPGPLTEEEWVIMRQHPVYAYKLIAPIEFLKPALDIPYCHHEKWDGSGYPRGLKGREIPLAARLFAVVDVWDALISDRPYRAGWPIERVLQQLRDGAGSHFDPQIVPLFLALLESSDAA